MRQEDHPQLFSNGRWSEGENFLGARRIFLNWFEKLLLLSAHLLSDEKRNHHIQSPDTIRGVVAD